MFGYNSDSDNDDILDTVDFGVDPSAVFSAAAPAPAPSDRPAEVVIPRPAQVGFFVLPAPRPAEDAPASRPLSPKNLGSR